MSGISNQSPAVLKKNSGASNVGTASGSSVQDWITSINNASDQNASDIAATNVSVAGVVSDLASTDSTVAGIASDLAATDLTIAGVASDLAATDATVAEKFNSANVIDEDDFSSDSDTKVPTQQSIKAYVDSKTGALGKFISSAEVGLAVSAVDISLPSEYEEFFLIVSGVAPDLDAKTLYCEVSDDGGSTFKSSNYGERAVFRGDAGAASSWVASNALQDASEGGSVSMVLHIFNANTTTSPIVVLVNIASIQFTGNLAAVASGVFTRTDLISVDTLRFSFASADIERGKFALYGVNL